MTASDRAILSAKWHALGGLKYRRVTPIAVEFEEFGEDATSPADDVLMQELGKLEATDGARRRRRRATDFVPRTQVGRV